MTQTWITLLRRHRPMLFLIAGALFLLQPGHASGQIVFGDPTLTIGGLNRFSLSIGGGAVIGQNLRFDASRVTYVTPTASLSMRTEEETGGARAEDVFLTGTFRLGQVAEVFGTVGQTQVTHDSLKGKFGTFFGGGIRISPPQPGPFKAGLVLQGFSGKSKDESFDFSLGLVQQNPDGPATPSCRKGRGKARGGLPCALIEKGRH